MEYDSTKKRGEPLKVIVGSGQLIDGLEIALMSMKLDEQANIFIKPKYGYGKIGHPPYVTGKDTIVYRV
jgi:FKBP-type peptidyl-prolyl cis-trans isomerase